MINWHQVGLAFALLVAGCSGGPKRVKPPKIDVSAAATQAIELYDTDHDGKLSLTEFGVGRSPAEAAKWFGRRDADPDGFLSKQEFLPVSAASETR